jgi:ADP-ribose pyrophosphatase YjhB (NUDIX family)
VSLDKIDRWAQNLTGLAQNGLAFTQSPYDRDRYHHVLHVVEEMHAHVHSGLDRQGEPINSDQLLAAVTPGRDGFKTPKVAVGAMITNDQGELLLIKRADNGAWLYPTGWCDIGYSAAEVAIKEVREETGINASIERVAMVLDGMQLGLVGVPAMYSIVFFGRAQGGVLKALEHEVTEAGWFDRDKLPEPLITYDTWRDVVWPLIDGDDVPVWFNQPRAD